MPRRKQADLCKRIYDFLNKNEDLVDTIVGEFPESSNVDLLVELRMVNKTKDKDKTLSFVPPLYFSTENESIQKLQKLSELEFRGRADGTEVWPASDYYDWDEIMYTSDLNPERYVYSTTEYETGSKGVKTNIEFKDDAEQGFWQAIYISFVVPYVMAKFSVANPLFEPDVCKGAFTFVYRGGGSGCLVKGRNEKIYGISCAHTFAYEGEKMRKTKEKTGFIIMDIKGNLSILSVPSKTMFIMNDEKHLDMAIAELRTNVTSALATLSVEKMVMPKFSRATPEGIRVVCVGSPSSIKPYGRGCKTRVVGPKNVKKGPKLQVCKQLRYAFLSVGKIDSDKDEDKEYAREWDTECTKETCFLHTAIAFEGMSGGGIFDDKGQLLGIHYDYDDDKGLGVAMSPKLYLQKLRQKGALGHVTTSSDMNDATASPVAMPCC